MAYDQFGRVIRSAPAPHIPSTQNSFSYQSTPTFSSYRSSYRESTWTRIDNAIRSFGNWFDDVIPTISNWAIGIVAVIGLINLLMFVFKDLNIFYMIFRIIGAWIMGCIGMVMIGIGSFAFGMGLKVLRFCLWNIYTLLLAIVVACGIGIYACTATPRHVKATPVHTEKVVTAVPTYRCTADVLNIRTAPNTYSNVIGVLKKGQIVNVYDTSNGFGRISYNGQIGYVSLDYLKKTNY